MKRRSFFAGLAALAASVLVPWKREAEPEITGEQTASGWRWSLHRQKSILVGWRLDPIQGDAIIGATVYVTRDNLHDQAAIMLEVAQDEVKDRNGEHIEHVIRIGGDSWTHEEGKELASRMAAYPTRLVFIRRGWSSTSA